MRALRRTTSSDVLPGSPTPDAASRTAPQRDPFLWAVLILQAALCVPGMATRSLWLDEAYSAVLARRSLVGIRLALEHDSGPPLYYALLHVWRGAFGESPLALRAPSLLLALGCTVLLYHLGALWFDRATARMATALFGSLPIAAFYAGEVRNYTLLAFLALLLVAVLAAPRLSAPVRFGSVAAILVATVYNHNVGWFVAASALGAAAVAYGRRVLRWWLAISLLAVVVAFLPWLSIFRAQAANIAWVRGLWSPWSPLQSLAAMPGFGFVPVYLDLPSGPGRWWIGAAALWLAPLAYAVVKLLRSGRRDASVPIVFLVLGLSLPALASALLQPMSLPGRHDFFLVPFAALLVAAGLRAMPLQLRYAGLAALLVAAIAATLSYARRTPDGDERAWTAVLAVSARPGDVVLCTGFTRPAAEYYLEGRGLVFASYPRQMAEDLAHLDEERYLASGALPADARAAVDGAVARAGPGRRVWVVSSPRPLNQALEGELATHPMLVAQPPVAEPRMGLRLLGEPITLLPFLVVPR